MQLFTLRLPNTDLTRNVPFSAFLTPFLRLFYLGADTEVGEQGVQLSGGQQQRVAIARLAVRRPSIVLLDEMTSALDTQSEALVLKSVNETLAGRTTLVVAHSFSAVSWCDRIVVLGSQGEVVEDGTPAELMGRSGSYVQHMARDGRDPVAVGGGGRAVVE